MTPYLDAVRARIVANYASIQHDCVAEWHLGLQDNFPFSEVEAPTLDAIAVICTKLRAAALVVALETETGIPIKDMIATAVWMAGVVSWGRLFGGKAGCRPVS